MKREVKATMGMEIEAYGVKDLYEFQNGKLKRDKANQKIPDARGRRYLERIEDEKQGTILKKLGLGLLYPDECSVSSTLCMIQKKVIAAGGAEEYVDFMAVTFDDLSNMEQLEFISAVGGGVLPYDEFLSEDNMRSVRSAVQNFPAAVESFKKSRGTGELSIEYGGKQAPRQFKAIFPEFAREIFKWFKPPTQKGMVATVHVTHSINPEAIAPEYYRQFSLRKN